MLQIEIDEAKTRLSELARNAANGEPFILSDAGKPVAKVVGYNGASRRRELFGCMKGLGYVAKDLDFKAFGREEIAEMFGLDSLD
jgi:prevent-host-death family protein